MTPVYGGIEPPSRTYRVKAETYTAGGERNAIRYHLVPTYHFRSGPSNLRIPPLPCSTAVRTIAERLGPKAPTTRRRGGISAGRSGPEEAATGIQNDHVVASVSK